MSEFKRNQILKEVRNICADEISVEQKLTKICQLLEENVPYYDWVGFYFAENEREELILGPFVGEPTEHTKIPYGKGICGQVARKQETFLINDVSAEQNYLACSIKVKSEIVIPIFKNGVFVAQLDIDSHTPSAFSDEDKQFLQDISEYVGNIL
ncbi:GAF domain-containing protein [bacterium]|nr:MAG: GAF domain-containing protein [bacterium]